MAESNATQVILTDDGLKIIKAQNTADEAVGNINDINSDNKLTPSEKIKLKQEYDKDLKLYAIDFSQLQSAGLSTTELETAMNNLTAFVTPLFQDMRSTSNVDRSALDGVFTAFVTADKNASQAFVNMVQQVADDAKKAGDDAKEAGAKAQEVGEEAKQAASQAQADATQAKTDAATAQQKAQSSIDQLNETNAKLDGEITDAKKSAQQALDNITVVDSKVTKLSDSTTAQFNTLTDGYQEVISTVNNMDIGGTNLLKNSKFDNKMNGWRNWSPQGMGTSTVEINPTGGGGDWPRQAIYSAKIVNTEADKNNQFGIAQDKVPVEPNTEYTFQLFNDGTDPITVQHGNGSNDPYVTKVLGSHRTTWTFKIPADVYNTNIYIGFDSGQSGTAWISLTKLEKGNKATDWSPAPEDLASQTQITTLNNLIDQKVSNDQYQSDKTQTADLISQTVTNAVDGIEIGSRNLVLNSNDLSSFRVWKADGDTKLSEDKKEITVTSSHGGINIERKSISNELPANGDTVVISADIKGNSHIQFNYNDGSKFIGSGTNIPATSEYKRYSTTFKWQPVDVSKTNFVIYTVGNKDQFLIIKNIKIEIGNKATDWSPAPEDLATSTEFDQLNNAIKLKANSSDVTSQINVATKGIQTDVTNKVSNLTTQINQTSDAIQLLAGTVGSRNLVYNATFEQKGSGFPYGWIRSSNASNETGYTSSVPASSYQGRHSIEVNTSKELGWVMFAQSDPQPLPVDNSVDAVNNVYSASMMVKVYGDGGAKPNGRVHVVLAFFDANKKRIESNYKGVWSQTATESNEQWQLVKVENLAPVAGAQYVAIQAFTYGVPTHAMINQPMVNIGATAQPFKPDMVNQASITASINNINLKVSNSDGSSSQVNMNSNTILLDANKIVFNGNTSIQNGTIGTAKIANAAINTAQIADGAINNAKIANASIDNAKISNVSGDKIIARSVTANKINVDDLIANGINTKTLTSVNLNTSTLTTPQLNLGLNGTFTEDFDYTQPTSIFLPKKNKGTLTFNHGVLQSKGNMQTYVGGQWGGMNDNYTFQAGIDNSQWTEVAPGYIKLDLFKQNDTDVAERTYVDPTGFYYTTNSNQAYTSYVGNIVSTPQVQTSSVLTKYIGPSAGQKLLQIDNNGSDYGLQVGSYAGKEAVLSDYIYNFTASTASNVYITANGHLARSTSASKYKYNIKNPDIETTLGDRLLNVHMATWNDKHAVDTYAEQLTTGEAKEKLSIKEHYGLIAEQMRDAGLDMFIDYGKNHEIEGIQYDRAWVPLLSVIRRLNDKVNEYELRLSRLEEKINE